MARGWESKSVSDQIEERQAQAAADSSALPRTPAETELQRKRASLLLSRAHTFAALESAANPRYRAMLERALAHLDAELSLL